MPDPPLDIRQRILDAGRERFFAVGVTRVTMDEIASSLGISKKTLYKHFAGKNDLADQVIDGYLRMVGSRVREIVQSEGDFMEKLRTLWSFVARVYGQVSKECQDDIRRSRPDAWKRIDDFRRETILANFTKLVEEGVRKGLVRGDVDKNILVLMYLTAVQGVLHPDVLMHHSFTAAEAYETIVRVIFHGILRNQEVPAPNMKSAG